MTLISLSAFDLALAALLVLLLAGLSLRLGLGLGRSLLIGACRTTVQLLLIGLVLKALFRHADLLWVALMAMVMLGVAGYEVLNRQQRRLRGWWGYGVGTGAMFVSSFTLALFALAVLIDVKPWYAPRYAVPLLGMLLGNTMNGIAVAIDRLTDGLWQQREVIEQRLLLGESAFEAVGDLRRDAMRSGMIPIINALATAGLVSLPGMMTGQILAGSSPLEAVKYQILIMFLITAGTGFGTAVALGLAGRRLFDERDRLRLEVLREG